MSRPIVLLPVLLLATAAPQTAPAQTPPNAPVLPTQVDAVLVAQVLLDRAHHSPGSIDGMMGGNTRRAVASFEAASGLPVDGQLDPELMARLQGQSTEPVLTGYRIVPTDLQGLVDVPEGMEAQASLERLGYETVVEALAEKYHTSQALLRRLNPEASFAAGETIAVVAPGSDELSAEIAQIEVDKSASELRAFDASGKLVATYPASIGSDTLASPSGSMEVRAVAPAPTYYFNPDGREWGPDRRLTIAAGPNNPVGSTWIDLTKDGYGIHGTPEPRLIGKTPSHGCVRLTNWDAEELGKAVGKGTTVQFI